MATELEFFLFDQTYDDARESGYRDLRLASGYNEDYHIFQTSKEEDVMRAIRNGLYGAGITVENSKGEASAGQEEINVKYDEAVVTADQHAIVKNGAKEIAWARGKAITFPRQVEQRGGRQFLAYPPVALVARRQADVLRSERPLRHVEDDGALCGGPSGRMPRR